jgi:hypothetical protein
LFNALDVVLAGDGIVDDGSEGIGDLWQLCHSRVGGSRDRHHPSFETVVLWQGPDRWEQSNTAG